MRSLRRQLTAMAIVLAVVVLAATTFAVVRVQREALHDAIDQDLVRRADELERRFAADLPTRIDDPFAEDRAVQIISADGVVLSSTSNLLGRGPVAAAPASREELRTVTDLPVDDGRFRLISRRISSGGKDVILHVAEDLDDVEEDLRFLRTSLLVAFSIVSAAIGLLTWWVVGRFLGPAQAAAARQARFVSDASHELRTPLTRLRTRLEVDLAHPEGVETRETLAAALTEARGMEQLVTNLLDLARYEDGKPRRDAMVDLDDIVLHAVRTIAPTTRKTIDVSAVSAATARGDRDDLARLVRNLLENATRYAAARVGVALTADDGTVTLTVDDDGPGIPPGQRESVFERFARLDPARATDTGGAGLGLAISREIVLAHGGSITVDEAPGGGARFRVRLPAA